MRIVPLVLAYGKFVYHCHLLSHEDNGMMATIEVTPPRGGDAAD